MKTQRRHHHRRRSSAGAGLPVDDGQVNGIDECRAAFWSKDGTVLDVADGREALKSNLRGVFKTTLRCLAVAVALILCIPIGMAIVKLSLLVLRR